MDINNAGRFYMIPAFARAGYGVTGRLLLSHAFIINL
jgi:hypothetical protein